MKAPEMIQSFLMITGKKIQFLTCISTFKTFLMFDRCNQEWHKRADIDKSRREFNWKVVEPYDGQFRSQLSKLKEGLGFSWEKNTILLF